MKFAVASFGHLKSEQLAVLHPIESLYVQESWSMYVRLIRIHPHSKGDFLYESNC